MEMLIFNIVQKIIRFVVVVAGRGLKLFLPLSLPNTKRRIFVCISIVVFVHLTIQDGFQSERTSFTKASARFVYEYQLFSKTNPTNTIKECI